jgi:hypothetical protein
VGLRKRARVDDFYADALVSVNEDIVRAESAFDINVQYRESLPGVQSSGFGRSCLIDQCAATPTWLVFTRRRNDLDAFTPGNMIATRLWSKSSATSSRSMLLS